MEQSGRPVGALVILPQAQWWLGRKVPMTGIASVSVLPEARRQGNASALMRATLRELYESRQPLSVLYSAADSLYRAMGYGEGGTYGLWRVPIPQIGIADAPAVQSVPLEVERLRPLQQRYARYHSGHLDRHPSIWAAIAAPDEDRLASSAYTVGPPDAPEGYVVCHPATEPSRLCVLDWAIATAAAGRALWSFFGQMGTQIDEVRWRGGVVNPMAMLLPEGTASLENVQYWRLRLVDVAKALAARGYPAAIATSLSIEVIDPILPENQGCWLLSVEGGRGDVTPGSKAQITLPIHHLASLYAGLVSPYQLQQTGEIEGSKVGLAIAAALFAGPSPWMPDFF